MHEPQHPRAPSPAKHVSVEFTGSSRSTVGASRENITRERSFLYGPAWPHIPSAGERRRERQRWKAAQGRIWLPCLWEAASPSFLQQAEGRGVFCSPRPMTGPKQPGSGYPPLLPPRPAPHPETNFRFFSTSCASPERTAGFHSPGPLGQPVACEDLKRKGARTFSPDRQNERKRQGAEAPYLL